MNGRLESLLRFINLTTSGLLAGSLGVGGVPLVPGWSSERPREAVGDERLHPAFLYLNAIGPVALATSVTLAVGSRGEPRVRRVLDSVAALGLAGVLASTMMVTVPINRRLELQPPIDYASDRSHSLTRNWSLARAVRRSLGIGAFVAAAASILAPRRA
jgi:Domain of unknown function (DUF1772)